MSNKIMTIEVGSFGLRAGKCLREKMLEEHSIDSNGNYHPHEENGFTSVYGNNYRCDKYIENAEVYFSEFEDPKLKESKYLQEIISNF